MASILDKLRAVAAVGALAAMAMATGAAMAGGGQPTLSKGKGDKCVEDTQYMRRNHMDLLKHHRDETMHRGIRTTRHSLKACIECHASEQTGSVAASKDDFCAGCHAYAAVKLDCWDCHATKPKAKPVQAAMPGMNALTAVQSGGESQ